MQSFVALDLELTPFSADQQRIIEIAAVRFRASEPAETFATLVDPRCALTPRIEALTGITQPQLDRAPSLECVVPDLLAFLGNDLLVGQSIGLDIECLASRGVKVPNPSYDTFELAALLLPGLPSYDLRTIALALGLEVDQEHRALADARVAGHVFLRLIGRAENLSPDVLAQVNQLASQLPGWAFADLFRKIQRRAARDAFALQSSPKQPRDVADHPTALHPSKEPVALDKAEIRPLLIPGGLLASAIPGFEERGEQLRMMDAVIDALNGSEHLLVEAGTGTGKSLAYLLPAIYFATRNGRPVVVSTNTINLQDQLQQKDIPMLQATLPLNFRAVLLKGRSNYVCLRRRQVLSGTANLRRAEVTLLIKTLIWLCSSRTGDRAELNLTEEEAGLWPRISAQAESCALSKCPNFRRGSCFVTRARRQAETAHLIVVNHALLLSDLATSGGVLPEYAHLVVDEAHHLEEEATEQLCFTTSCVDLSTFLAGLYQVGSARRPVGFLRDLLSSLRERQFLPETILRIRTLIAAVENRVETAEAEAKSLFEALHCFLLDHCKERAQSGLRLRITPSVRVQPEWSEIDVRWGELSSELESLQKLLGSLSSEVDRLEIAQLPDRDGVLAELAGFDAYLDRLCIEADEALSNPRPNGIYWVDSPGTLEDVAVRSAPLHVGEALNNALFSTKASVILTSATITAEGSFDYIKERLGLESAGELVVGSPFDFKRSTMLYVVRDIPEPNRPGYQRAMENAITDLALAMEGRTLVLFTSHAQLRVTSGAIRPRLEQEGILVLAHGVDGSRRRLLQAFVGSGKAILMGTSSFWEGIDVVGDALSCVVIAKLPFAVPTDPIFAARSESFDEPFRQYSVPQTILRFKQGFGRLIRTKGDRGLVVILDSRIASKFYGPSFIHSLPACTLRMGSAQHLGDEARSWLTMPGERQTSERSCLCGAEWHPRSPAPGTR